MTVAPVIPNEPVQINLKTTKQIPSTRNSISNNSSSITSAMGSTLSRIVAKKEKVLREKEKAPTTNGVTSPAATKPTNALTNGPAHSVAHPPVPHPAGYSPLAHARSPTLPIDLAQTGGNTIGDAITETLSEAHSKPVDLSAVRTFPLDYQLTYLAEGAANVIYRISAADGQELEPRYRQKLLRLRKALPSASPNHPAFESLQNRFWPLLPPGSTISTVLEHLPAGLIDRENARLKAMEATPGARKESRHGLYLAPDETFAFLLEDMTPHPLLANHTGPEVLVEFKPKWLVQSPSAPPNARRCRTCALRLRKLAQAKKKGKAVPKDILKSAYCPFDLESGDPDRVRKAVVKMLHGKGALKLPVGLPPLTEEQWEVLTTRTTTCLLQNDLIKKLAELQRDLDQQGLITTLQNYEEGSMAEEDLEGAVGKLATCMTLRDLTLFLKVDLHPEVTDAVKLRIGDLDLKSPGKGKADYWVRTEKVLIEEGWYTGGEDRSVLPDGVAGREEVESWCTL
ncbi:hypothetical protein BJ508DRAFT_415914 [Ascobolus immersus RN42]|uniref:Inositol-pentakisphosphate 2-kinase n=1 Tax=Ascobolus immersus RN42 TaxID=1160509 RepID=A0A3N4I408_ASCIM|nr:hypothetical protein BJ508DRAFT_415914 [Ascobolus immersus RN42]